MRGRGRRGRGGFEMATLRSVWHIVVCKNADFLDILSFLTPPRSRELTVVARSSCVYLGKV